MRKFKLKRTKSKPGLINIKQSNDIILNGEHEFKHEEQSYQLSANTSSLIEKQRGNFEDVIGLKDNSVPQADRFIYSSFDARPFNGRDINYKVSIFTGSTGTTITPTFTVPTGYVFVLRQIKVVVDYFPSNTVISMNDIVASLVINGAIDPYNQNLDLVLVPPVQASAISGSADNYLSYDLRLYNFYNVIDQNSTVGYKTTFTSTFVNHNFNFYFVGNLLIKTGVSANFETGFDTNALTTFKNR